jgi:hypothetical protein
MHRLVASLLALLAAGCTELLPPAATPAPVPPTLAEAPPVEPGTQRLVLEVVDGPTDVFELTARTVRVRTRRGPRLRTRTERHLLCRTPCAVDLPQGRYVLGFPMHGGGNRLERETIHLGPQVLVHRRALGSYRGAGPGLPLGIVGTTFGGMAMVVGAVLLPVGAAREEDGMALAGGINLGAGALLLTLGILGIALDPAVEQPGSGITFAM